MNNGDKRPSTNGERSVAVASWPVVPGRKAPR